MSRRVHRYLMLAIIIGILFTGAAYYKTHTTELIQSKNCITLQTTQHGYPFSFYRTSDNVGICTIAIHSVSFSLVGFFADMLIWGSVSFTGIVAFNYMRHRK